MGNEASVPARREPYVNQQASYNTMLRNVNQARLVGNPDPVKQVAGAEVGAILKAASPKGFDLTETTMADRSELETKAAECRTYTGLGGIRDLELKAGTRTAFEPGCGWMYKNGGVNRGAFGSEGDPSAPNNPRAPVFSRQGERDEVAGGATFIMDLEKAERLVSKDMVNGITSCQDMSAKLGVSDVAPYIGFCKTSGRVIPVQRKPTGGAIARFTDDVEFRCAPNQIVLPENTAACPPRGSTQQASRVLGSERFQNYERAGSGGADRGSAAGSFEKAFSQPSWALNNQLASIPQPMTFTKEGFAEIGPNVSLYARRGDGFTNTQKNNEGFASGNSLRPSPNGGSGRHEGFAVGTSSTDTDFERCKARGTLANDGASKQCIILAARQAGFGDTGSFLKFMVTNTPTPVFENYKRLLPDTDFIPSTFTDGTKTINDIVNILTNVRLNISNSDDEISTAAKDIVTDAGVYSAEYNLCSWIEKASADTDTIRAGDQTTEICLQNFWKNNSGDSRGIEFPTLAKWAGSTIGQFKQAFKLIADDVKSSDMEVQSAAIAKQFGVNTYSEQVRVTSVATAQDCEREKVSDTQGSCPTVLQRGLPVPKYVIKYKVKDGKDAVAGGNPCVLEETKDCTPTICDPVDCQGGWQEHEACSTTCGNGVRSEKYVITRHASCGGQQCPHKAEDIKPNIPCKTRECSADDCKYKRVPVRTCPTDPGSPANCGKTFTKLINLVPDESYAPNIARMCPTTPMEESCGAVVACPSILPANVDPCEVILYYEENYRTRQGYPDFVRFSINDWNGEIDFKHFKLKAINDAVRSIRVGSDVTVALYEHEGYGGRVMNISSDTPSLGGMNNILSSLIIRPKPGGRCEPPRPAVPDCEVWFYYESNYGTRPGFPAYTKLSVGNYDWQDSFIKSWEMNQVASGQVNTRPVDDQIKSIRVGRGVRVTVFPHPGYTGGGTTFTSDQANLGGMFGYGPGISSLKVEPNGQVQACLPPPPPPAGCSSTRTYLGTFTLQSLNVKSSPSVGEILMDINPNAPNWNFIGYDWRKPIKFSDQSLDNKLVATDLRSIGVTRGIPLDGTGAGEINNNDPSDRLSALAPWWNDRDFQRGTPRKPYIANKFGFYGWNIGFGWPAAIYAGETFCIILEHESNPSSSITLTRMGRPINTGGGIYQFWPMQMILKNYGLSPFAAHEGWSRNWNHGNFGVYPYPDSSVGVANGAPILGGRYKIFWSIRSSDVPGAQQKGFKVYT